MAKSEVIKDSKVLLITGGSRVIGRELVFCSAREGYSVAVNYRSSAEEAQFVVHEIAELSGTAISVQADVSSSAEIRGMIASVIEDLGRLDCVIHNAGEGKIADLERLDEEMFEQTLRVNLLSALWCHRLPSRTGKSEAVA